MAKLMIIGAGGVGTVVAHQAASHPEVFDRILLASRTKSKCDTIAAAVKTARGVEIATAGVDAEDIPALTALLKSFRPEIVINVALPYQDLAIMEACLAAGVNYLDTANYEPRDEAKFEYSWQWAYRERFTKAGLTAILGCGFDPGVTGVFTAYAAKHYFDELRTLDIIDCNAGDHGKAFATNFNPEINIREVTQKGKYWENGSWVYTEPHEIHRPVTYPGIGPKESYLIYHEELESLTKNFPSLKRARFWMTFGQEYLTHLRVIQNIGMARITGQTSIGCRIRGVKDGEEHGYYIWNNCSHEAAYAETGAQGVSYTTGVPAVVGAMMFMQGSWKRPGVWNVEEFDPDPFLDQLARDGLPWNEEHDGDLEF